MTNLIEVVINRVLLMYFRNMRQAFAIIPGVLPMEANSRKLHCF